MKFRTREFPQLARRLMLLCLIATGTASVAHGQALPTASRKINLSAFGALTGVYTDLNNGRNLSITAGADLNLKRYFSLYPSIEVRGTFPIDRGNVGSMMNLLGGVKVASHIGRIQPYGNFLIGGGQIRYGSGLLSPDRRFFYTQSNSTVFSPGAGIDFRLTNRIDAKVEGQFQHYETPVTTSGHLWAKAISIGGVYRF